jgi:MFS family permease
MLIGTLFTLAAPLAPSLGVFYLSRIMGGLFLSPGNTLGLVIIEDIFFFHEHARKIGLWLSIYLCAPFLSPLLGSFIIAGTGDWRALFWVTFAICCLEMLLIALFMDETWYDRSEAPPRASRAPRLMLLLGLSQIQKREYCDMSPKKSFFRLISILWKPIVPPVLLAQ